MSVYKSLRNKSNIKFLQDIRKLRALCFRLILRIPKRCRRYFEASILDYCNTISMCLHNADSVYINRNCNENFFDLREIYFEKAKINLKSLSSEMDFLYDVIREDNVGFDTKADMDKKFNTLTDLISDLLKEVETVMKRDREKRIRWNKNVHNELNTEISKVLNSV